MITLLALMLRLVVLAIFTFAFVVLFEYGPTNYWEHAQADASQVQHWVKQKLAKDSPVPRPDPAASPVTTPTSTTDPTPPAAPATTPETPSPPVPADGTPDSPPSDWQKLQTKPMGEDSDSSPSQ